MEFNLDLSKFWCWQKDCPDYEKMNAGNIVLKRAIRRTTGRFSSAEPVVIASARLTEHHSSASMRQWMKSVEHWHKFRKKEAFAVRHGVVSQS